MSDNSMHLSFPHVFATRKRDGAYRLSDTAYEFDAAAREAAGEAARKAAASSSGSASCADAHSECDGACEEHDIWLIPEASMADGVMLFRARPDAFPLKWDFHQFLIAGKGFTDPVVFRAKATDRRTLPASRCAAPM